MSDRQENLNDLGERSRRYGIRDGAFQAVMQGSGENYLSAFALLLQASALQIGILSALPQLVGTLAQLLSVKILHRFRQRKSLILAGAIGQTILWAPLLALPLLFPDQGPWLFITCTMLYVAMGQFAIPAWNSLITDVVDSNRRGSYFGHRARVMAVTSFVVLCVAGLVLHSSELWREPWVGFAIIFTIAAVARAVSTMYLARIDETAAPPRCETEFRLLEFLARHPGRVYSREQLLDAVWKETRFITPRSVDVYVRRLREKIEPDPDNPSYIVTVRGSGYRFEVFA